MWVGCGWLCLQSRLILHAWRMCRVNCTLLFSHTSCGFVLMPVFRHLPLPPRQFYKAVETTSWVFMIVSLSDKLEISPIYHQNHRNTPKNTVIFNWSLWKAVMVRELMSVLRNTPFSHHDCFQRPQRLQAGFLRVFLLLII